MELNAFPGGKQHADVDGTVFIYAGRLGRAHSRAGLRQAAIGAEHRSQARQLKRLGGRYLPLRLPDLPIVAIQRSIAGVNRIVALALACVWLAAGAAGIVLGVVHGRWLFAVMGVFAVWYAILWFRVVARARRLTWSELAAP